MATLELTNDQVLVLKAAWEYFIEADDHIEALADALEATPESRGMDDDGEYLDGRDEESDSIAIQINELGALVLAL